MTYQLGTNIPYSIYGYILSMFQGKKIYEYLYYYKKLVGYIASGILKRDFFRLHLRSLLKK